MRTSIRAAVTAFATLTLLACGAPMGMGPGGNPHYQPAEHHDPGAASSARPSCDKSNCRDYCRAASCLFDEVGLGANCMAVCESRCGDGFFDDTDAKQIACAIRAGVSISCDGVRACCEEHFTNQVCEQ